MKYMLMLYDNPNARDLVTPAHMDQMRSLMAELTDSGELLGTDAYADSSQSRTVRFPGGSATVSDGPYAETKEHMGGFLLLDCESHERAIEIAKGWPADLTAGIEVRPILNAGA